MAPPVRAEIAFVSLKSCLVNLPPSLIALLSSANTPAQNVVVELQYRSQTLSSNSVSSGNGAGFQRSIFVGWTGMPSRTRSNSSLNERPRSGNRDHEIHMVEIDAAFAKVLGLVEGQKSGILVHLNPPVAHTINIEPMTATDWEVIELHATFLELNLLSQIRALPNPSYTHQTSTQGEHNHPLTLHLSPTSTANIIVKSLVPSLADNIPFAKIAPDAEVIVAPKTRPTSSRSTRGDARSTASRRSGKSVASDSRDPKSRRSSTGKNALFLRAIDRKVASGFFHGEGASSESNGLAIWLRNDVMMTEPLKGVNWVDITIVKPAGLRAQLDQSQIQKLKDEENSEAGRPAAKVVAQILAWPNAVDNHHVVLSSALATMLGATDPSGIIVRIEPAVQPLPRNSLRNFKFFPFLPSSMKKADGLKFGGDSNNARQAIVDQLRLTHGRENGLLWGSLTDGMVLPPSGDPSSSSSFHGGILRFSRSTNNSQNSQRGLAWVYGKEQKQEIEIGADIPHPVDLTTLFPTFAHGLPESSPQLIGFNSLLKKCMSNLTLCSSVLLTGGIGSGKTSLAQTLGNSLRDDHFFNVTYFSCQKLVTDEIQVSSIRDTLNRLFMSASWCARLGGQSMVILDDLDKICPSETELQVGNNNERSRQVTELLSAVVRQYCNIDSGVVLLATTQSKDALHSNIIGGHIVGDIISIKAPSKETRRDILRNLLANDQTPAAGVIGRHNHSRHTSESRSLSENSWMDPSNPSSRPGSASSSLPDGFRISSSLDLLEVAGKTDGFMPADLTLLVSRARNESLIRTVSAVDSHDAGLVLKKTDFDSALQNFTPASLRNVTLTHSSTTFSSVGGLTDTRNTLLETLLYPTKYAPIFARSPLRLRSGLLLYGYPGCGKTLLASAVAGECNLNFISVKGPEILNKYIGASEKSVRDLFERAQAAKPCVLFFDEFDSIAPKRGHDSTGVTDRVVNQMLTQMDGAEGLEGVYVLAATSRPDLIDPALLRPGRLDKSLLCDMPSRSDRRDILTAVSTRLRLNTDVKNRLSDIARMTDGFSGADLQALMYNAHLEAIHDLLGDRTSDKSKPNGTKDTKRPPLSSRTSTNSSKKKEKQDFTQFLYGPTEDAEAKTTPSAAAADSRATIAAKLDELKDLRKQKKAMLRGRGREGGSDSNGHNNNNDGGGQGEDEGEVVVIEWRHIERALATTKSSISPDEKRRLAAIYEEFVVGRNGEMPSGQGGTEIGGRSSLM